MPHHSIVPEIVVEAAQAAQQQHSLDKVCRYRPYSTSTLCESLYRTTIAPAEHRIDDPSLLKYLKILTTRSTLQSCLRTVAFTVRLVHSRHFWPLLYCNAETCKHL